MSVEALKRRDAPPAGPASPDAAAAPAETAARPPARDRKRIILAMVGGLLGLAVVWKGYDYLTVGRYLVSTDDAYIGAENAQIASLCSGLRPN